MNEIIGSVSQYAGTGIAFLHSTTVLIATIILGAFLGIFGLKLSRIWSALVGFILGLGIGSAIVVAASLTGMKALGVLLGCAAVLAVVFCIFYKIGMFFYLILITAGLVAYVAGSASIVVIGVGALLGLIFAILSVKWFDPVVIIVTSGNGAILTGRSIVSLLMLEKLLPAEIGIPVVLFIIFMVIQFFMKSKQVGKEQTKHAKEHKAKTSRENEVERARNMLDLDDLEDEYDDDYEDDESYYDDESCDEDDEFLDDDDFEYYEDDEEEYYDDEVMEDDDFDEYEEDDELEEDDDFTIL